MTPGEKIDFFVKRRDEAREKYKSIKSEQVDLIIERKMKVIDHKVLAVGERIQSKDPY
jgi:hypothetical protein